MKSPKISVIVPVYNMEKLMRRCIDSILVQTFTDYECLLIDDGSKDGSPAICDEYAYKDVRFKTYHKPNGGLSDARNYGLERAIGDYTIFFDPDDYVDSTYLEELYSKAIVEDADMVMCGIFYEDQNQCRFSKQQPTALDHWAVLKDLLDTTIYGFTVNKLIRRSCYIQYHVVYPTNIYGCEDQYALCALLKNDIKISYLPRAFYHYIYYPNSLSRHYDEKTYQNDLKTREMFVNLMQDTPYKDLAYLRKTTYMFGRAFNFGSKYFSSKKFRKEFLQYEDMIKTVYYVPIRRTMYWLSFRGFYQLAFHMWNTMRLVKKQLKNIKHKFLK